MPTRTPSTIPSIPIAATSASGTTPKGPLATGRRLHDPLRRVRHHPGAVYHGSCCCCCCCILMPVGNYLAVISSHAKSKSTHSVWWHLFINILCFCFSVTAVGIPVSVMQPNSNVVIAGMGFGICFLYLALLQLTSRWWMPETIAPDRRFLLVGMEWILSLIFMVGFAAMSMFICFKIWF